MFPYRKIKKFCKKVGYSLHDFKEKFCVSAKRFEDPEELWEYELNDDPYYEGMIKDCSKENPMYHLVYKWYENVGTMEGARVDFVWSFWILSDGRVVARCTERCAEWKSPKWETFMSLNGDITTAPC